MAEYGVTEKGFVLKRFDTILSEMQAVVSSALGFDISLNPQSALNAAIIMPMAESFAELWEVAQDSYYAKYPSTAEGINLDNACQYGAVLREGNARTEYSIHCTGTDGTVIPANSYIASDTNPAVSLYAIRQALLTRQACNALGIRVVSAGAGAYTVTVDGIAHTYTASASDTAEAILTGLKALLGGFNTELDTENLVLSVGLPTSSATANFELSNNLTTATVTGIVNYYTAEYGAFELPEGTITNIVTTVPGLEKVTNKIAPTLGRLVQTDIELRQDYIAKVASAAQNTAEAISSYILSSVSDVTSAVVFENATANTDAYGRPAHSIEVVVDGGDETAIANCILSKKPAGISTYGSESVTVVGSYGDAVTINFNRPEVIYAWLKVVLTTDGTALPPNYVSLIKDAIMDGVSTMTIGDDFLIQRYLTTIYTAVDGLSYVSLTRATSSDASTEPAASAYTAANIEATNRQVVEFSPDRIEVTVS